MLRVGDSNVVETSIKARTIAIYSIVIRNAIRKRTIEVLRRISSLRIVIFVIIDVRSTSIEALNISEILLETSLVRELLIISFNRKSAIINEYRPSHINIKDVIVFAFLKIKKYYNLRY